MGIRKISLTILMTAFAVSLACGCSKKAVDSASVSESVSESISSVSEEKEPEVSESENDSEQFIYSTYEELAAGLYEKARESLVEKGVISEDDVLFYDGYYDYEDESQDSGFEEEYVWEPEYVYISLDEKGLKDIFVAKAVEETNGKAGRINSFSVFTLEEYAKEVGNGEDAPDSIVPLGLNAILSAGLSSLRADSGETVKEFVEKVTADGTLSRYSPVIDYVYESASDKEVFTDPVKVVKYFFPFLEGDSFDTIKCRENFEFVTYNNGDELQIICCECFKKSESGEKLYLPSDFSPCSYETAVRWQKTIENLTLEDLDNAHPNPPEWDGFHEDGSMFFVVAQTEDESATLYCVYDDEYFIDGYMILRINDRIIPINEMAEYGWGIGLFQGDFDKDGEDEFAVTINDGHGTGYYLEELIVVDPGEKEPVCEITSEDLRYRGENVYSKIKAEYDESTEELTYWLEDNGSASAKESVSLKGVFEEDEKYKGMLFGDLFSITFEDGQLGFLARGGIITDKRMGDYEYSLVLTGDFNYKDGRITYDNLHLEYEHQK